MQKENKEHLLIKQTLLDYYNLKEEIDGLEKRLEAQKPAVVAALKLMPDNKYEMPGVTKFSLRRTVTYKYSDDVELLDKNIRDQVQEFEDSIAEDRENLKALKLQEETDGTAKEVKGTEKFVPIVPLAKK